MILYEKKFGSFNLLFRIYGAPWPRAVFLSIPSAVAAVLLQLYARSYLAHCYLHPYPYSLFASSVAFLIIFRMNLSYSRYWEARSNISTMSSKWADAVIQVISFDEAAKDVPGGTQFRAEFLHTMSLMHALAMQSLRGERSLRSLTSASFLGVEDPPPVDAAQLHDWVVARGARSYLFLRADPQHYEQYWTSQPLPVIGGLNRLEECVLAPSADRVFLIFCWVHRELVARRSVGGIREDAPIVSRIYQVLSDGMNGFEQALKVRNTPFPFPYAQSSAILLHLNAIGLPILMANWIGEAWLAGLTTYLVNFSLYLLHEVSREVEEPYRFDPNDLPLAHLHHCFNSRLVTAFLSSLLPEGGGGGDGCTSAFDHIDGKAIEPLLQSRRPSSGRGFANGGGGGGGRDGAPCYCSVETTNCV